MAAANAKTVLISLAGLALAEANTAIDDEITTQEGLGFVLTSSRQIEFPNDAGTFENAVALDFSKPLYLYGPGAITWSVFGAAIVGDPGAVTVDVVNGEFVGIGDALAHTITLPAVPSEGDRVFIKDVAGAGLAGVIIDGTTKNVEQIATRLASATTSVITQGVGAYVAFIYDGTQWRITQEYLPAP